MPQNWELVGILSDLESVNGKPVILPERIEDCRDYFKIGDVLTYKCGSVFTITYVDQDTIKSRGA